MARHGRVVTALLARRRALLAVPAAPAADPRLLGTTRQASDPTLSGGQAEVVVPLPWTPTADNALGEPTMVATQNGSPDFAGQMIGFGTDGGTGGMWHHRYNSGYTITAGRHAWDATDGTGLFRFTSTLGVGSSCSTAPDQGNLHGGGSANIGLFWDYTGGAAGFPVTVGETVTVSMDVRVASATGGVTDGAVRIMAYAQDAPEGTLTSVDNVSDKYGAGGGDSWGSSATAAVANGSSGTWVRISAQMVVPTGSGSLRIRVAPEFIHTSGTVTGSDGEIVVEVRNARMTNATVDATAWVGPSIEAGDSVLVVVAAEGATTDVSTPAGFTEHAAITQGSIVQLVYGLDNAAADGANAVRVPLSGGTVGTVATLHHLRDLDATALASATYRTTQGTGTKVTGSTVDVARQTEPFGHLSAVAVSGARGGQDHIGITPVGGDYVVGADPDVNGEKQSIGGGVDVTQWALVHEADVGHFPAVPVVAYGTSRSWIATTVLFALGDTAPLPAFTPSMLPWPAWYTGAGLTPGTITSWPNSGMLGATMDASSVGGTPNAVASGIGGHPSVEFDSASGEFARTANLTVSMTGARYVAAVVRFDTLANQDLVKDGASWRVQPRSNGDIRVNGGSILTAAAAYAATTPLFVAVLFDGVSSTVEVDGTQVATGDTGANSNARLDLMSGATGALADLWWLPRAPTAAEVAALEGWVDGRGVTIA